MLYDPPSLRAARRIGSDYDALRPVDKAVISGFDPSTLSLEERLTASPTQSPTTGMEGHCAFLQKCGGDPPRRIHLRIPSNAKR